jgi:protein-S-isoprenylcysteine O-methyltransferase Ste14
MLNLKSPKGLKPEGTGPLFLVLLLPILALAIGATLLWPDVTRFPAASLRLAGVAWLVLGILFWALSMRSFLPGFKRGELVTTGTYGWCRNPIYASLLMFWLPAVGLLVGTWTFYVAAAVGWPLARATVRREEAELARLFGERWQAYASGTTALLPLPPKIRLLRVLAGIFWAAFALLLVGTALLRQANQG